MIQHIDRDRRVQQRTYDPHWVAQKVIDEVGPRRFMAYRLLRQENRSQREAAQYLGCHRRTAERWAQRVELVISRFRAELQNQ